MAQQRRELLSGGSNERSVVYISPSGTHHADASCATSAPRILIHHARPSPPKKNKQNKTKKQSKTSFWRTWGGAWTA